MRKLSDRLNGLFDIDDPGDFISQEADTLAYGPELREMLNSWFMINFPDTLEALRRTGIDCPYSIEPEGNNVLIRVREGIDDIVMSSAEHAHAAINLNSALLTRFCKKHNKGLIISGEIRNIFITGDNIFGSIDLEGVRILLRPSGPELSNINLESRKSVRCTGSEIGIETKSLSKLDTFEGGRLVIQGDEIVLDRDQFRSRALVLCSADRYSAPKYDIRSLRLPNLRLQNSEFGTDISINLFNRLKKKIKDTEFLMDTKTLSETLNLPSGILEFYISNRPENNFLEARAKSRNANIWVQQIDSGKFRIYET